MNLKNETSKKKVLIYGLGKSGISALNYLKHNNSCYIFDDDKSKNTRNFKKFFLNKSKIIDSKFDKIILSPGININKCLLSNYLKKNLQKIVSDLDIFYEFRPEILTISITGTNGKSTTSKLLHDILKYHGYDVRLTGNIGNPILEEKRIKKNTILVVEVSSYQLAYSKYFRSKYSIILNISNDHLERHLTMKNYITSKLKSVTNQKKNDISIIPNVNRIKSILKSKLVKSNVIFLKQNKYTHFKEKIKNRYFSNSINFQNLNFIFELSNYLKLNKKTILKIIDNFKPLKFRQQLIYNSKDFKIINDSKSTTLSSTIPFLKSNKKIYWILGGLFKKGDKFNLNKKNCRNIEAFIFGKDKKIFAKILKNKLKLNIAKDLKETLKKISRIIKNEKHKITILFSPAAASFDQFKNFEHRGEYFNFLIKKYLLKQ